MSKAGVPESEKLSSSTVRFTVAVCDPLVPVTAKLKGFGVEAERPLRVSVVLWPAKIVVGLKLQLKVVGQDRLMLPVKPVTALALIVKVVEVEPMIVETVAALDARENRARPVPERDTPCGLPVALSLMLSVPVLLPLAAGANTIETEQLWPTLRALNTAAQVLVCLKSPVTVIPVMSRVEVPVFVIVTVCAWETDETCVLGKVMLVGATVTAVAWVTPVPVTVSVCGLLAALSVIVNSSVTAPVDWGVKVTLMAQLPPAGATVPTQLFESVKSLLGASTSLIVSGAVPRLKTVTVWTVLATLTASLPKSSLAGDNMMAGELAELTSVTKALPATPARSP